MDPSEPEEAVPGVGDDGGEVVAAALFAGSDVLEAVLAVLVVLVMLEVPVVLVVLVDGTRVILDTPSLPGG
jgi:hypothetical protein